MNINQIAYTAFVAFISVVITLLVVGFFTDQDTRPEGEQRFTLDEVAEHDTADSCWKAIEGGVYDLTDYIGEHPTEESVFTRWCGQDATDAWQNKTPGRPHSPRAADRLDDFRIGRLDQDATTQAKPQAPEPEKASREAIPAQDQWRTSILGQPLNGVYRGSFIDRDHIQVTLQFRLEDGQLKDMRFRHLAYRGDDFLAMGEDHELYGVANQHRQVLERLEGQPLQAIFDLYQPERLVDDVDGYSGATLRGAKILSAIRDGLNRGVYSW